MSLPKTILIGIIALLTQACFSKPPGPCYDCQLFMTVQDGATVSTSSSYHEQCDSLSMVNFILRNTSSTTTYREGGSIIHIVTYSASCTRQ